MCANILLQHRRSVELKTELIPWYSRSSADHRLRSFSDGWFLLVPVNLSPNTSCRPARASVRLVMNGWARQSPFALGGAATHRQWQHGTQCPCRCTYPTGCERNGYRCRDAERLLISWSSVRVAHGPPIQTRAYAGFLFPGYLLGLYSIFQTRIITCSCRSLE